MLARVVSAILLCGLAAGCVFAGSKEKEDVLYKMSGTEAGAFLQLTTSDGGYVSLSIAPAVSPDNKKVYRVSYADCDRTPVCKSINGLVSPSAVTRAGGGLLAPMTVHISPASFISTPDIVGGEPGMLVGTFIPYSGPNSWSNTRSGFSSSEQVHADGTKLTLSFSGHEVQSSATFTGIVRSTQVMTPPGANIFMFVQKGTTLQTSTPAP